jgi:hypothetical protein
MQSAKLALASRGVLMSARNFGLSSRPALGGGGNLDTQAGSRGAVTQHTSGAEILLPAGSIASPVSVLKSLNLTQAILDGLAVLFGFLFLAALVGSVPLAIGLLIFAKYH